MLYLDCKQPFLPFEIHNVYKWSASSSSSLNLSWSSYRLQTLRPNNMISSLAGRKEPDNDSLSRQGSKRGYMELTGYYSVLEYLELVKR
jgi:hypothetical protein